MSGEKCATCGIVVEAKRGRVVEHHRATGITGVWQNQRCLGSNASSVETRAKRRAETDEKKRDAIGRARADAAVVLDAVLASRDVETLFPGRVEILLKLALTEYQLKYEKVRGRVQWPWRFEQRGNVSSWDGNGDVYCIMCGELLAVSVDRSSVALLRTHHPINPGAAFDRARIRAVTRHTTPCALQCLAGMRKYAAPGARFLPIEVTP